MTLTTWLRSVFSRRKNPLSQHRTANIVELGLVRLEDRRVLSVSGGEVMLFSIGGTGATLPDVGPVQASDIVSYDGSEFAIVFDGSDVGLSSAAIDAIAWRGDNQILLSFAGTTNIQGLGNVTGSDIVLFEANSLGNQTSGSFSLFLRGSDLGLTTSAGNVDALDVLEDGSLVISTLGNVTLPAGPNGASISVRAEDLVQITPDANGNFATGTMRVFFDGSDVGLTFQTEQLDAVAVNGPQIRFSTSGSFFIDSQGIGGSREDVLTFNATSLGESTSGAYVGITFDGSQVLGFGFDLSALEFATLPSQNHLPTAADVTVTTGEDNSIQVQLVGDDGEADLDQPLTYQIVDGPDFGVVTDFDPATGTFSYLPNVNFAGTDRIVYLVQETDANGTVFTSELASVNLTVTAVNDAPVVYVGQTQFTANQGEPILIQGLSVEDVEAASEFHSIVVTLQIENGTISVSGNGSPVAITGNGTGEVLLTGTIGAINAILSQGVTAQTDPGFSGTASVILTIQDGVDAGGALIATATVELNILAPPPPPPPPPPAPELPPPPPAPEPPASLQDRIKELLESGELNRNQAKVLQNVLKHPDRERLIEKALKKIDRWENRGKIGSDLAKELTNRLEELLEDADDDRNCRPGHHNIVDKIFEQLGKGKPKCVGRFRC